MRPKAWIAAALVASMVAVGAMPVAHSVPALPILGGAVPTVPDAPETVAPTTGRLVSSDPAADIASPATQGAAPPPSGLPLPGSPYTRFLQGLLATHDATGPVLVDLVRQYYHEMGFSVPSSAAIDYEDNATTTYSHELGDASGDGTDDILLDQYCNDGDACLERRQFNIANPLGSLSGPKQCGWPHRLYAISGRDGTELWNQTLDLSTNPVGVGGALLNYCVMEFVVGMVPTQNHTSHALMYKLTTNGVAIIHELYLLNGSTGKREWKQSLLVDGYVVNALVYVLGWNVLLNPMLQVPRDFGVPLLSPNTTTGLLVQSVGFNITGAGTPPPPWALGGYAIINSYQPNEWAASLEPLTGATLWRHKTFQPNGRVTSTPYTPGQQLPEGVPWGNRSVIPWVLQDPYSFGEGIMNPGMPANIAPARTDKWYWHFKPCCYDLTGDGHPELVYTAIEFSSTPTTNFEGPYDIDERVVVYDGLSGNVVWDIYPGRNIQSLVNLRVEMAGDMDGDGAAELLLHQWWYQWDFHHQVSIVNGKTGTTLWRHDDKREFDVLVIGDADRDGGNDVAIVNWTMDISFYGERYGRANVTETPVVVYSGRDGRLLWTEGTFMAVTDLIYMHELLRINRLLDADHDGAADLLFDDPLFLPDLTVVHRITVRAGADGRAVYSYLTAGAFSFPSVSSDQDGDHVDDYLVVNGDINDLWITTYTGTNGTALWSRRLIATRDSSYFGAFPQMRTHRVRTVGAETENFVINFQLAVTHITTFGGRGVGYTSAKPQLVIYWGTNGTIRWATPSVWDLNLTVVVPGMSPASKQLMNAMNFQAALDGVPPPPLVTPMQATAGVAVFASAFGASFLIAGRRRPF